MSEIRLLPFFVLNNSRKKQLQVIENMERETGIGPATNSLEGCDSTTELLPLIRTYFSIANPPPGRRSNFSLR